MSVYECGTCRVYGHLWDSMSVAFLASEYHETLKCDRCSAIRVGYVQKRTGFVRGRKYRYPHNYQLKGGVTKERR